MRRPGPACSICADDARRPDIDATRGSLADVAHRFGITKSSLARHRKHASNAVEKQEVNAGPTSPQDASSGRRALLAKPRTNGAQPAAQASPESTPALDEPTERLDPRREAEAAVRAGRRLLSQVERDEHASPRERSSALSTLTAAIRMLTAVTAVEVTEEQVRDCPAFIAIVERFKKRLEVSPHGREIAGELLEALEGL